MTEYDKNNLDFLLSLDPKSFELWSSQASNDDLIYSMEIIQQYKEEIEPYIHVLENDKKVNQLDNYDMSKNVIKSLIHKK
jgi:hypothetical protein